MARDLDATLTLLAAQVVPYPVPLDEPLVSREFTERVLSRLAAESDLATVATVLLCRDRNDALRAELRPQSLVVIGSARRWMPRRDASLVKLLRRDGHSVFIASQRAVPVPPLPKLAVAMESRR
jgi:hypothetical protein